MIRRRTTAALPAAAALVLASAVALAGCQSTQETEAAAPATYEGLEATLGLWDGRWPDGARGRVEVVVRDAGGFTVKYCYQSDCRRGCVPEQCPGYQALHSISFVNGTLRFSWASADFEFTRDGDVMNGKLGRHTIRMRRKQ